MSDEKKKERIDKFEDLIAWQKARKLTQGIYQTSRRGAFAKDFGFDFESRRLKLQMLWRLKLD